MAEPDYPNDCPGDGSGWVALRGVYQAPAQSSQAIIELHLRWASKASVEWRDISMTAVEPPPARTVRIAAAHYVPHDSGSAMESCLQFEPLLEEASRQKADLVVLPETITATGNGLSYLEAAEPIPGPASDYFAGQAKRHGLHLVAGLVEQDGHMIYNTAS